MTWRFRPGQDPQEQLKDLEKTLDLDNLKADVLTDFPAAGPQETITKYVDNGGLWLVVLQGGQRYRVQLTAF